MQSSDQESPRPPFLSPPASPSVKTPSPLLQAPSPWLQSCTATPTTHTLYFSLFPCHASLNQHPNFLAATLTFHIFGTNGLQISKWCWAAGRCLCCGWKQFVGPCWDVLEQGTLDCLCCPLALPTATGTVLGPQQDFPGYLWWWEHAKSHRAWSFHKTCCKPLLALGLATHNNRGPAHIERDNGRGCTNISFLFSNK